MATTNYVYPSAQKLIEIEADYLLTSLQPDDPIFSHFAISQDTDDVLRWDQRDHFRGLQQIRGINGEPPKVARVGAKGYLMEPGVYGEKIAVDEREMTKRRKLGTFGDRINITDIIRDLQDNLIVREYTRIRQILWTLVTTGTFSVSTKDGVIVQTDSFPVQTFTSSVPWATAATATPLADLRAVSLLSRGHSVRFNSKSTAYMNRLTANYLLANNNAADLAGKRGASGATFNSLNTDNNIFLENDLPQVVVMDDGYYDDTDNFPLFIPNNKVVLFGVRPSGQPIGEYRKTYNANSNAPGSYMQIVDNMGEDVPRQIVCHRGHNGGPVLYYGSAIVVLNV